MRGSRDLALLGMSPSSEEAGDAAVEGLGLGSRGDRHAVDFVNNGVAIGLVALGEVAIVAMDEQILSAEPLDTQGDKLAGRRLGYRGGCVLGSTGGRDLGLTGGSLLGDLGRLVGVPSLDLGRKQRLGTVSTGQVGEPGQALGPVVDPPLGGGLAAVAGAERLGIVVELLPAGIVRCDHAVGALGDCKARPVGVGRRDQLGEHRLPDGLRPSDLSGGPGEIGQAGGGCVAGGGEGSRGVAVVLLLAPAVGAELAALGVGLALAIVGRAVDLHPVGVPARVIEIVPAHLFSPARWIRASFIMLQNYGSL